MRLPPVVMHGTPLRFDVFDPVSVGSTTSGVEEDEVGFFFTARKRTALRYAKGRQARIIHAELRPANPYCVTGAQWGAGEGLSPRDALEAGHDCYHVAPYEDGPMWIALDPSIIRIVAMEEVHSLRR